MSLDEAYLDLTENLVNRAGLSDQERTFPKSFGENDPNDVITFGTDVEGCVQEIRHRIYLATELTASAGTDIINAFCMIIVLFKLEWNI